MSFTPLQRRSGRIAYRARTGGAAWGMEHWSVVREGTGGRTLVAHCEMALGADHVVRDTTLMVDAAFQPQEAYVRILNHGVPTGSGWFRFGETHAEGECCTDALGRLSQRMAITRPMRGFGIHALMGDGWLAANFPFHEGAGYEWFAGTNLLHSLHHLGATGPSLVTSTSGLRYEGVEEVTVPAGTFACHRLGFVGMTNAHPPYVMWISADGDFLFVRGEVAGYMDAVFELETLDGGPLA